MLPGGMVLVHQWKIQTWLISFPENKNNPQLPAIGYIYNSVKL